MTSVVSRYDCPLILILILIVSCLLLQSLGYSEGAGLTNGKVTPGSPDRSNSRRLSMENMQVGRRTKYLYKLILIPLFAHASNLC